MISPLLAYVLVRINHRILFLGKPLECFPRNCHIQLSKYCPAALAHFLLLWSAWNGFVCPTYS